MVQKLLWKIIMIPIPNYEDYYAIKNDGVVIRIDSGKALKPSINPQTGYLYVSLWKNNEGKTFSVHRLVANAYLPNPDNKPFVNHKNSIRTDAYVGNLEWCTQSENISHGYTYGFMTQEQRRNNTEFELELLLKTVLGGQTMTSIATSLGIGLSRLTVNLRRKATELGLLQEYEKELRHQKNLRNALANANSRRPVLQISLDGILIAEHESITAATKAIGKSSSGTISNALNPSKKQYSAYGFLWKYK